MYNFCTATVKTKNKNTRFIIYFVFVHVRTYHLISLEPVTFPGTGPQGFQLLQAQAWRGLPQGHLRSFPWNPWPPGCSCGVSQSRVWRGLCHLLQRSDSFLNHCNAWKIIMLMKTYFWQQKVKGVVVLSMCKRTMGEPSKGKMLNNSLACHIMGFCRRWYLPLQRQNQGCRRERV